MQLNSAQQKAVEHAEGPLMILAGAGAGKTRVITHRIVHLIKQGVAPDAILALTFTNKAAREMRERVEALITADKDINRPVSAQATGMPLPFVSTFHALGVWLLRKHARELGLSRHFTIFDRADSMRVVKQAIKALGLDPKHIEPRSILSALSRQKGEGVSASEYQADIGDTWNHTVGRVWQEYDRRLNEEGALDFDDLLLHTYRLLRDNEHARRACHARWTHVHIDEYQDTNGIQFALTQLLVSTAHNNICVVGDIDQCLVAGTRITMADGAQKRIEHVRKGDTLHSNHGSGAYKPSKVMRVHKKQRHGKLVRIITASGKKLESTPEHMHFAGYVPGESPQRFFTYLMYKRNSGWRLGTSQTYTRGARTACVGFVQRSNQEHADATWVIAAHTTPEEARELEYVLSLRYRLPTVPFVARVGGSRNGYVHNQQALDRIFASFDTEYSARKLMREYGLSREHPHHAPQSRNGNRNRIVLTLCGEKRAGPPLHRIAMVGNDTKRKQLLASLGLSVRPAKPGSRSWRFETAHANWNVVCALAERIRSAMPECEIAYRARLGNMNTSANTRRACSLPFMPAASVREGMVVCNDTGQWDTITHVEHIEKGVHTVYDIDVERVHNYVANGLVTHNSIYSWRGAHLENLLSFEDAFPNTTVVVLEENYRSTQTILRAANTVIEKNVRRKEKTLFTRNHEGDPILCYSARSEDDEAQFIVTQAAKLVQQGASPRDIAVLYRANFQSRALEQAFMYAGVPYQVLGTRFFDRKEVKDVLSYIRAALNPKGHGDVARIIATPPRGIGKMTLAKMIEGKEHELTPAAQKKVSDFHALLAAIAAHASKERPSDTVRFVIEKAGLARVLKKGTEEDQERLENMKELATLAAKYDALSPEEGMAKLLEDAALATDQDSLERNHNAVKLMTIHASKGLEFDSVFITGLEDGLFPHERLDDDADDEEERRLFYVALTRARVRVFLSHALVRTVYGSQTLQSPSPFLEDIDEELIEYVNESSSRSGQAGERSIDLIDF